jgi:hypothetical protein
MKESSDTEKKGMRRGNPPLSATSLYPSESDKYKGKDEVGSYSCVRNGRGSREEADKRMNRSETV